MDNIRFEYFFVTSLEIDQLVSSRIKSLETASTRKQDYLDREKNISRSSVFSKNALFNEWGAQGWELITVNNGEYIFKRKSGREAVWAVTLSD